MWINPALILCALAYESPFRAAGKPFPQTVTDSENILKYMGDRGPYVNRRGYGINRDPPAGCEVEQAVFLGRHGERFPNPEDYTEIYDVLKKILKHSGHLNGSLTFANDWEPVLEEHSSLLGQETTVGLYSGLLDAYSMGVETRRRYFNLYNESTPLKFYASNSSRVVDTAILFGSGFLNRHYPELGEVVVIPEKNGANTLKPSCKPKRKRTGKSTCKGDVTDGWIYPEFEIAASRLNYENPEINLTAADIPRLIYQIPSEIDQRGTSDWIPVFTSEEFVAFNYWVTSRLYCTVGPGSHTGPLEGQVFLEAARKLLKDGPEESGPLTFAFTHHTTILPILATLGIDEADGQWDPTEVQFGQRYDVTDLTPMGARLVFERLRCPNKGNPYKQDSSEELLEKVDKSDRPAIHEDVWRTLTADQQVRLARRAEKQDSSFSTASKHKRDEDVYVRFVLNEAVVPLDGCSNGPGKTCRLDKFDRYIHKRSEKRSFQSECIIPDDQPKQLTFFWD